jgi:hypothetical protein
MKPSLVGKYLCLSFYLLAPLALVWTYKYFFGGPKSELVSSKDSIALTQTIPETINYNFDVKPILSDNCYTCHGPDADARQANLRLDTDAGAFGYAKNLSTKPIIKPGNPKESALVFHINSKDPKTQMPPPDSNLSLSEREKQILEKWIAQGATWEGHWAYQIPKKGVLPQTNLSDWAQNEIDFFIASKIQVRGLKPSPPAEKEIILRRLAFDLTGLPPSLELMDRFLHDESDQAYERMVDHLMKQPQFGERMASVWLDVARYADTHGYQDDLERIMWPWRDWVINAFNKNLPYDEFITWQLAGDLLDEPTLEQIVATGYNRNHKITQEGGVIDEEYRVEYVADRAITTSKALMGITVECARCHDHKYDAVSQKEFFSLYSFFNNVDEKGRIEYGETPAPFITIDKEIVKEELSFLHLPDSIPKVELMVMEEVADLRKTYTLSRGQYDAPEEEVQPGTPSRILPFDKKYAQNRLGLAKWFFDEKNPLTSRVVVNRFWQQFFGRGLVATPEDFGNQGARPSHPELLDWLAVTFRAEDQWNIKAFIKRIVMSGTYRQSSKQIDELNRMDPTNTLLAHYPRQKLPAEMIRDNALVTSGLLNTTIGGPSVKPHQPEGLWEETTSGQGLTQYQPDGGSNRFRRSLYTFWKRTVPPPNMITFDAPTRDLCTVERQKTSTPLQSLVLLNDPQFFNAAKAIAEKIDTEVGLQTESEKILKLFRTITLRKPTDEEKKLLNNYFDALLSNSSVTTENPLVDLALLIYNLDETTQKS